MKRKRHPFEKPDVKLEGINLQQLLMDVQQQFMLEQNQSGGKPFLCNLCMKSPKEPVLVQCGHVFCWACISRAYEIRKSCPTCEEPFSIEASYPIFIDESRHQNYGEENIQLDMPLTKRPKPVYNDKIPNPSMGAGGSQLGISNLSNNVTQRKKIAGYGCSAACFIQTFNSIQQPLPEQPDKKVASFCSMVQKIAIGILCLVLILCLFAVI